MKSDYYHTNTQEIHKVRIKVSVWNFESDERHEKEIRWQEKIPKLERVFRIITEKTLIAILRKDEIYMKQHSKERYYSLVDTIPNFAQRVPQYMIASYLDITPEYLSEIRKSR